MTKFSILTISDAKVEIGNDVAGNYNSMQLHPTQQSAEFLPTLSNDMQSLVESQQLDFI